MHEKRDDLLDNFSIITELIDDENVEKIELKGKLPLVNYNNSLCNFFNVYFKGEKKPREFAAKINLAFSAHVDSGKTTAVESAFFNAGLISKAGTVKEGKTQMDSMAQERERGITIQSASANFCHNNVLLNVIDTPGHSDFSVEVERSLRVIDGVILLLDVSKGVQSQTSVIWQQLSLPENNITRMLFFNKMDGPNPDFFGCLKSVEEKFNCNPIVMQLPIFLKKDGEMFEKFCGIVDLIHMEAWIYDTSLDEIKNYKVLGDLNLVSKELFKLALEWREKMISKIVEELATLDSEGDNEILSKIMSSIASFGETSLIKRTIKKLSILKKICPVFCGSAYKNIGVNLLLNAAVDYFPSYLEVGSIKAKNTTDELVVKISPFSPNFSALAFKVVADKHGSKIVFIRIYSGKIFPNKIYYNINKKEKFTVGRVVKVHSTSISASLSEASSGDIVGLVGIKNSNISTGDTLSSGNNDLVLESIKFSQPIVSEAIIPRDNNSIVKIIGALESLASQDPTFKYEVDKDTGQLVIWGIGLLHLEVIVQRMFTEYNLSKNDFSITKPKVSLYESITGMVSGSNTILVERLVKQTGGAGKFAGIRFSVHESKGGLEFINNVVSGEISQEYFNSAKEGMERQLREGLMWGYPVKDVKIIIHGGQTHSVDSSPEAFRMVGAAALRNHKDKFNFSLLEPIVKLELEVPSDIIGSARAECMTRRAKINQDSELENYNFSTSDVSSHTLKFFLPLAESFGLSDSLKNITKGKSKIHMEFSHYSKVPNKDVERVIKSQQLDEK